VKPNEILIGQCAALTGPASGLGTGVQLGLRAALDEANEKGGIGGRKITLKSLDGAYEPEKSVECISKLIEEEGVFALAGYVGTSTAKVAMPIVQEILISQVVPAPSDTSQRLTREYQAALKKTARPRKRLPTQAVKVMSMDACC
jgi:ABC-type branched-subunit amino acid transport system substrate-binding protein